MEIKPTSALLELVGLRDMAEEEPSLFLNRTAASRAIMEATIKSSKIDDQYRTWLDSCFIQTKNLASLVKITAEIRDRLLTHSRPIFSRSTIIPGEFSSKNRKGEFTLTAARLQGRVSRLKACAIEVDEDTSGLRSEIPLFPNFYWPTSLSGAPTKFYDVQFTSNSAIQSALNLNALFNEITHAISRSEKAPRFFTPILVNLARHLHPPKFIEFVEIIHTDEEVYTLVKKVLPEGEFIVFTIIDRFFEDLDKDEQTFAHQLTGIIESWTGGGRGWLIERLNKTNKHGPVPDQIIRPEHRGRWRALAIKDPAKPAK